VNVRGLDGSRSKVIALDEVAELVPDGASIVTGGVLMARKPIALLDAITRAGRRGLTLWTMIGSLDVELLAARRALAEAHAIYVGFEQLGAAPAFAGAVARAEVEQFEHSELLLLGGLRAGAAGVPFMPTRGGIGSDLLASLNLKRVECPYTGETLVAAPAVRPDVALLHAEAADERGTVIGPVEHDFLSDFDGHAARAAKRVVVSVERVASREEVRDERHRVVLLPPEVDWIVPAPGGARPCALPGCYAAEPARLRAYLDAARGGDDSAIDRLVAA
jgi:glutaconate CoA-transferase subunit A